MADDITVFECARGDDVDLDVALPASWAAIHEDARVVFEDTDVFGWHAFLESSSGVRLLSFPWYDHVDEMLRGEDPTELPPSALPADGWDDLEQGWWAVVRQDGGAVYLAETNLDRLLGVRGVPRAELVRPGLVELAGVPVCWNRISPEAWSQAWEAARDSCIRGSPSPSRPFQPADR